MAEDFDYRSVLGKALTTLLDILDPVPILDQFTQDAFLSNTTIRDIRENRYTTEKNRAIVKHVKNKGPKGYGKFKTFLQNAHQEHVADYLEKIEKEVGTGQNQATKPRMESQTTDEGAGTLNIGGKGSANTFGGQTNLENVNIGRQTTDAVTHIEENLREPLYAIWMKNGLAINITNEVIRPFAVREMTNFHQNIIAVIQKGVVCTTCTVEIADRCPKNICSHIKNEIVRHHWFAKPSFQNTCIQSWLTDPWEIAKCYMPPGEGYRQTTAASSDFSASINVIMNCRYLKRFISRDPNVRNDKYFKARNFRNTVMHSKSMKISDNDMKSNLDILIDILKELPDLGSKDAAVTKLNEIKNNTVTLTMDDILKVREHAMLTMELELRLDRIHQGLADIKSEVKLGEQAIQNEVDKEMVECGPGDDLYQQAIDILVNNLTLLTIQKVLRIEKQVSAIIEYELTDVHPDLAALGNIDERKLYIYMRALEKGREELKHIRLMVVGMFGVGKTCLVRRLLNEDIGDVKSTVGIDINVKVCELNDDGTWVKRTKPVDQENDILKRATDVVVNHRSNEPGDRTNQPQRQKKEHKMCSKPTQNEQGKKHTDPPPLSVDQQRFEDSFLRPKAPPIEDMSHFRNMGKNEGGNKFIQGVKSSVQKPTPSGRKPTVSIWDFAGQSVYYSTHHFFISSRSIYLLVFDISKPLDTIVKETDDDWHTTGLFQGSMKKDYTCLDAFMFSVTSIYAYTKSTEGTYKDFRPTIVLIGTHGDKLEGNRQQKEMLKDLYFEEAQKAFDWTPVAELFHPKTFLVSCTEDEPNVFDGLKMDITKIAQKQIYWGEFIPAKWLPLERSIEFEKKNGKKLMKFNEVDKGNAESELKLEDRNEIMLFLRLQHSLGNVMYFDAPHLEDKVILDPQWIIDMFKLFVTHQPEVPNELIELWKEYRDTAKLRQQILEFIISMHESNEKEKKNNLKANATDVIRYMEHLDVIAKPVSPTKEDFYIVPCVLKQLKLEEDVMMKNELNVPEKTPRKSTPIICFVFDNGCLPPSVFHRLLVTYIKKKEIKMLGSKYVLYNGFGAFELDDSKTLCIWYTDFFICARVTLHDKHNRILYTDDCISLRHEIKRTISTILLLDQQKNSGSVSATTADAASTLTEYIMCERKFVKRPLTVIQSTHRYDLKVGLHNVEELKTKPSVPCLCSKAKTNAHNIYTNDALKYWYEEPHYLKKISDWFKAREREDADFLSKAVVERDCLELSDFVNENEFNKLGSLLEIESGTISTIANGTEILRDKVHELFCKWLGTFERPPTCQDLKDKLYILKEVMANQNG